MATRAEALTSTTGDYGSAKTGDVIVLRDSNAKELEEKGVIKILGKASDDEGAEGFRAYNESTSKGEPTSLRIHDQTVKSGKTGAEGDTDPKNPTGNKAAAKKAAAKKSSGKK